MGRLPGKLDISVMSSGVGFIVTTGGQTALGSINVSWNTIEKELVLTLLCTLKCLYSSEQKGPSSAWVLTAEIETADIPSPSACFPG